ncbi:hypothetical protein I3J27_21420 [Bradyrhizobium xenonodulans]|uniref:Transposase n=1 Tax=Bradyrhizobium xenonodulans TaxID=2736875 RepID=A0ABY7MFB2_9BRAD|nr:hypothetical protein [Bradyrhizobium xenonodulans]WBL75595.1 hypothetical protein I3J27_21420 [Bradyrhizobium xenonodulans]
MVVMTGHQRRLIREHNDRAWMVHTAEALRRTKKMPPLRRLQARVPRARQKRQSWQDMKAVAKLLTQAFDGNIVSKQDVP